MKWHNPGLGEVHNEDHSQMIYCEDADGIVDDGLAKGVCDLLNSKVQPEVEPVAWIKPVSELLGHISDVLSDEDFNKIDTAKWNAVSTLVGVATIATPSAPALDAETAIKNCLEAGETMRVLKHVVNLLLESRRNLGPEDHELRDRITKLFRHDAAIAAQSAQGKEGHK